jgi:tryptophanase
MEDFFFGCDRKPDDFASVGFTVELIKDYGIRTAESGPFGWEWDKKSPEERVKIPNLVRFAVPRHVMSEEHINYTVAAVKELHGRRHTIPNMVITRGKDMRLRHFSSGLKPVPVDQTISGSYFDEASRQLTSLSQAVGISSVEKDQLLEAFKLSAGKYGDDTVPKKVDDGKWISDVSNDHTFFEYSVNIDQETGDSVLRFLIEAQAEKPASVTEPLQSGEGKDIMLGHLKESAATLSAELAKQYASAVSIDRLKTIEDLFGSFQSSEGKFAAFHSCVSTKNGPEWKIYLNPRGKGSQNAQSITSEAFERLGLAESWKLVKSIIEDDDAPVYFSLDLSSDLEHSRVKLYIAHPDATASTIAEKHAKICPGTCTYTIQQFCNTMAGGSLGPYKAKPLLSCFSFTSETPTKPSGTVHFPISEYAENDAVVRDRMEKYMDVASVSAAYRERYQKAVSAVQRRPLDQGRGIHAWISLKQSGKGKKGTTFYLSPEVFGPL